MFFLVPTALQPPLHTQHNSRLGAQPTNFPSSSNKLRSNSSTLRRDSSDLNRVHPKSYSSTGVTVSSSHYPTSLWSSHRFGLTSSQSTDTLLSARYFYHNPLLLGSSALFKDFLLGPDYGHGWLATNSGKLSKLG